MTLFDRRRQARPQTWPKLLLLHVRYIAWRGTSFERDSDLTTAKSELLPAPPVFYPRRPDMTSRWIATTHHHAVLH